ncbi:MAG: hypothetical protein EBU90_04630 [Proteobacteria bacterium]|nr:hypothetical protein [Pseudomonadota bacterium]NBP13727.1 hypothetical protein [bacterium]
MKHVGKMKSNSARVAVVYRTLPNEHMNALVVGTNGLPDAYHDSLMSVIESEAGQQANELADILATRRFPDGEVMLSWLHTRGQLKKVPTNLVLMTPNNQTQIPLDKLNEIIAEQKGVSVEELAVTDGSQKKEKTAKSKEEVVVPPADDPEYKQMVNEAPYHPGYEGAVFDKPVTASDLRSMADKLFKEAQALRKKAEEMEPTKKKTKADKVEAE